MATHYGIRPKGNARSILNILRNSAVVYTLKNRFEPDAVAIRVRRSSDNEQDDFTSDEIFDRTLESWVGVAMIDSSYDLDSDTGSTSSTTQTSIASFSSSAYGSAKLVVQISDSSTGERQISELLVTHDGTDAFATEYGVVHTGTDPLASFDVDIDAGNVRLLATSASSNSTSYTVAETLMV